jgi:hypothetical protein
MLLAALYILQQGDNQHPTVPYLPKLEQEVLNIYLCPTVTATTILQFSFAQTHTRNTQYQLYLGMSDSNINQHPETSYFPHSSNI